MRRAGMSLAVGVLASALLSSAASAEATLHFDSTVTETLPGGGLGSAVTVKIAGDALLPATGPGRYEGVGTLTHVAFAMEPSQVCEEGTCVFLVLDETPGTFRAVVTTTGVGASRSIAHAAITVTLRPTEPVETRASFEGSEISAGVRVYTFFAIYEIVHQPQLGPDGFELANWQSADGRTFTTTTTGQRLFNGAAQAEGTSYTLTLPPEPVLLLVQPECGAGTWVQGVPAFNTVQALFDWKDSELPHQAVFVLNGSTRILDAVGDVAQTSYDMGTELQPGDNALEVHGRAGDGATTHVEVITWTQTPITPWAAPASAWAANGSRCAAYTRAKLPWPLDVVPLQVDVNLPLIGGPVGLVGSTLSFDPFVASPTGRSLTTTLEGSKLIFGGARRTFPVPVTGQADGTLTPDGLTLEGRASVSQPLGPLTKRISLLDLIPGLTTWCANAGWVWPRICDAVSSVAGIEFRLEGRGTLTGDYENDVNVIEWTGGTSGSARITGTVALTLGPKGFAGVEANGSAATCADFDITPTPRVTKWGAELQVQALAWWGSSVATATSEWPIQGEGCDASGAAVELAASDGASIGRLAAPAAASDGDVTILAWSAEGAGGQGSDITVTRLDDGAGWTTRLTDDPHADLHPSVAIADDGTVLVAWERSRSPITPASPADVGAWVLTLDIVSVALDPLTGALLGCVDVTADSAFDLSPGLSRGADGSILLAWQSCAGDDPFGTAEDPVTLHAAWWDAGTWTDATSVVTLHDCLGWHAASHDRDEAAMVVEADGDGSLASSDDRVVRRFDFHGAWTERDVTEGGTSETDALIAFAPDGTALAAWLRDGELVVQSGTEPPVDVLLDESPTGLGSGSMLALGRHDALIALPGGAGATVLRVDLTQSPAVVEALPTAPDITTDVALMRAGTLVLGGLHRSLAGQPPAASDTGAYVLEAIVAVGCPEDGDADADGISDDCDACPDVADDQADADGDGRGDACDACPASPAWREEPACGCGAADGDADGVPDCADGCLLLADPSQVDADADGIGDACDFSWGDAVPSAHGHVVSAADVVKALRAASGLDPATSWLLLRLNVAPATGAVLLTPARTPPWSVGAADVALLRDVVLGRADFTAVR